MSDLMEEVENLNPQVKRTKLIRDSLPETVRRLKWIISMNDQAQWRFFVFFNLNSIHFCFFS